MYTYLYMHTNIHFTYINTYTLHIVLLYVYGMFSQQKNKTTSPPRKPMIFDSILCTVRQSFSIYMTPWFLVMFGAREFQ